MQVFFDQTWEHCHSKVEYHLKENLLKQQFLILVKPFVLKSSGFLRTCTCVFSQIYDNKWVYKLIFAR